MDKKILRLLIVDDSPDDADIPVSVLRKHGYMLKSQRVQDLAGMQSALNEAKWDLVVSEYRLPHLGAMLALDTIKHIKPDLPFFILTKKINDADLIEVMRAGARDVILKSEPARIVPAIERELAVVEGWDNYKKTTALLQEIENKHQAMIDGSMEAICYSHDGMHVDANKAYLDLFGYGGLEELEGVPVLDLIDKSDRARFKSYLRKVDKNNKKPTEPQEFQARKKNGSKARIYVSVSVINIGGEDCTQIVVDDASKHGGSDNDSGETGLRDPLTGAYKRDYFLQALAKAAGQVKGGGKASALLYIELDGLKVINDRFGKAAGDRLLRQVGEYFGDALDNAVLSRFGGDEFAVLLYENNQKNAEAVAEKLKQCVKDASRAALGQAEAAECTLGLIMIDRTAGSVEKILSLAYGACEQAKKQTRAQSASPREEARTNQKEPYSRGIRTWQQRIQKALDYGAFQLVYQPVINLIGDPSEYFEVLIRLPGDGDELISAGEFMPAAEQSGQIHAIDQWVIKHALSGLADLHKNGQKASFFVNLSQHASHNKELVPLIHQSLRDNGLSGEYLILETDESAIGNDPQAAEEFIRHVTQLGCRISLDNFGARLASLGHLRDLPIEFLKIDTAVVSNVATDNIKQLVLKTIVQIAKLLNKKTIGKCVEDEDTLSLLYSYELDYLQGNYFQYANTQPQFAFAGETTLSSDIDTPGGSWPPTS
ncbi:MAG: EAL domain-containing protein [Gammaproteobacteria bacterium]|nr:EAL domain-containing protein [Gammaproteobacteria bacterium]